MGIDLSGICRTAKDMEKVSLTTKMATSIMANGQTA